MVDIFPVDDPVQIKAHLQTVFPDQCEEAYQKIQQALNRLTVGVVHWNKTSGSLLVTPDTIQRVRYLSKMSGYCEIETKPQDSIDAILLLDPEEALRSLIDEMRNIREIYPPWLGWGSGKIMLSTLKFPYVCCACMQPANHLDLVEAGLHWRNETITGIKKDEERLFQALLETRYWYLLPFCAEHNLSSNTVAIFGKENFGGGPQDTIKINFTNIEYGQQFAHANKLSFLTVTREIAMKRTIRAVGTLAAILGGVGTAGAIFSKDVNWLLAPALVLLLIGIILWIAGAEN